MKLSGNKINLPITKRFCETAGEVTRSDVSCLLRVCVSPQMCADESPLRKAAGTLADTRERVRSANKRAEETF